MGLLCFKCLSQSSGTMPILGTAGGWQLLLLLTQSDTCHLTPLQAQHDEENPVKSLSLPLLPKLHPCRTDTLASEGAGGSCGNALMHNVSPMQPRPCSLVRSH